MNHYPALLHDDPPLLRAVLMTSAEHRVGPCLGTEDGYFSMTCPIAGPAGQPECTNTFCFARDTRV